MNKTILLGLLVAVAGGLVGGAVSWHIFSGALVHAQNRPARVLEAEEFRLIEPDGTLRGKLSINGEGAAELELTGRHTPEKIILSVSPDGKPWLFVGSRDGPKILIDTALFGEYPGLAIFGGASLGRTGRSIHLGMLAGFPSLGFSGDEPIRDYSRRPRTLPLSLGLEPGPMVSGDAPFLKLRTVSGMAEMSVAGDSPYLWFYEHGSKRLALGQTILTSKADETIYRPTSSITLFDERGDVVASMP